MFSDHGRSLGQDANPQGRGAGPWPWPVRIRLFLALCAFIAGIALRVAVHSAGCDARTFARVAPVLVIDPNTAPASVLEALPHVGPSLVQRLIEQREIRPFGSTDDLRRVRGIGPVTLARLAPHLRIKPDRQRSAAGTAMISSAPVLPRLARGPSSHFSSR